MEINEKKLNEVIALATKEVLRKQREDYQRYLEVLTENFEPQIKLIAESVSGIQTQLIAIRNMIAKNTEDIEMIKVNIHIIKNDIKEKVGRDEFVALEKRLFLLEKKLQRTF